MKRKSCIYAILLCAIIALLITYYFAGAGIDKLLQIEEMSKREYANSKDYYIFIDIPANTLYLFRKDKLEKKYIIASGAKGTPTPLGIYTIISKGRWGEGFGGCWMGLNVPWGRYGIHGTTKPETIGRAASHGCIRMKSKDANELYNKVGYGTTVEIYGGPFGPFGNGFRILHPGDRGADVVVVQRVLKSKGYYDGSLDGIYGIYMEKALNKFQRDNDLPIKNNIDDYMYKSLGIVLVE